MAWLNGDGEINGADPWGYEYDEEYIPNKLFYHSKIFFDSIGVKPSFSTSFEDFDCACD